MMTVLVLGGIVSRGEGGGAMSIVAALIVGPLVALYVGLNRHAAAEPTRAALALDAPTRRQWAAIALAVAAGAALAPIAVEVTNRIMAAWPIPAPEEASEPRPADVVIVGIALVTAAPLVEEMLFRGFLQPRLVRTLGATRGWFAVVALYTAAQVNPRFMPAALLVGATTGLFALAAGTTWAPIAGHVSCQATPFVLAALDRPLRGFAATGGEPVGPAALAGCGAVVAVLILAAFRWRSGTRS